MISSVSDACSNYDFILRVSTIAFMSLQDSVGNSWHIWLISGIFSVSNSLAIVLILSRLLEEKRFLHSMIYFAKILSEDAGTKGKLSG